MSRAESFKAELQALIDKYECDIEADDHYQGYPECGQDIRITVSFPTTYEDSRGYQRIKDEYEDLDLGRYISPTPKVT